MLCFMNYGGYHLPSNATIYLVILNGNLLQSLPFQSNHHCDTKQLWHTLMLMKNIHE
jgi:hypothetical protein